jgi:two-component system sensor histidine kinase SenX3
MRITRRGPAIAFFILLGCLLVGLAITLNVGWIILNWRRLMPMVLGVPVFLLLIAGVVLNTIFLVREVRRNERHDSFLNAVTHELKTPIASIRLYLETLQRHQVPEAKRQEFYSVMLSDADRLLSTVEQVLKAGELGHRTGRDTHEPVDLSSLAASMIATTLQRQHLPEDAILLESSPGPVLPILVKGSPEDLGTAIQNLLINAIKYSPDTIRVRVRLNATDDLVSLEVADQGIGIGAAHLKHIFKRFYRVPARNVLRTKGTGLGLFIVRSIARQHGGDAFASSAGEGHGATIRLQLPRYLPEPAAEGQAIARARQA